MSFYNINVFTSFDPAAILDPQQELMGQGNVSNYLNTVPGSQTLSISAHNTNQITQLVITSNGITDGNFQLYPIKYTNESVNFVVSLLDLYGNTVRDYPLILLSNLNLYLQQITTGNILTQVEFFSNFGTLSSLTQGGFFKGTFTSTMSALSVVLVATLNTNGLNLTGYSNTFSIYPSGGIYQLRKVNENFNQTAAYLDLAVQPVLQDKPVLFYDLLGQIVGNANSDPNTLGIETFEKISNYISNINDIDYSNLAQLKSMLDNINSTYQDFNYNYPPSLRRLTDMLSIKHKKLFGETNQWQQNFITNGFYNTTTYGKNRGPVLNFNTTVLSAGSGINPNYIVTYENFSQVYNLVNTNLLNLTSYQTTTFSVSTYPLSAVDNTWGWGLVLPKDRNIDIGLYYTFYQYVPGNQGALLQEFIDFNNPNNTLSITNSAYTDYIGEGGIMDNILLDNVYTSLNLLSSVITPSITPTASVTPSLTPTASLTPTPTASSAVNPSPSPTPTITPSTITSGSIFFNNLLPNGAPYYYVNAPNVNNYNFGYGDFTIEWYQYVTSQNHRYVYSVGISANNLYPLDTQFQSVFFDYFGGNNALIFALSGGTTAAKQAAVYFIPTYANEWVHFAVTRNTSQVKFFMNGIQVGTTQTVSDYIEGNGPNSLFRLGQGEDPHSTPGFNGYITNFRMVSGTSLYNSNFTVPSLPLSNIPGTSILFLANSPATFANDSSTYNLATTAVSATYSNFTPFPFYPLPSPSPTASSAVNPSPSPTPTPTPSHS